VQNALSARIQGLGNTEIPTIFDPPSNPRNLQSFFSSLRPSPAPAVFTGPAWQPPTVPEVTSEIPEIDRFLSESYLASEAELERVYSVSSSIGLAERISRALGGPAVLRGLQLLQLLHALDCKSEIAEISDLKSVLLRLRTVEHPEVRSRSGALADLLGFGGELRVSEPSLPSLLSEEAPRSAFGFIKSRQA
jgi:hypothetical protein